MMNIAYFGTADFSGDFLQKLINDKAAPVQVVLVVTQPDKPVGRKQIPTPSPVKIIAQQNQIEVYDGDAQSPDLIKKINDLKIELCLLFAYGEIISEELLKAPKRGFWNIHPSLLPRYRGASPIAFPLMMGDRETGTSLMIMDRELDHGPLLGQKGYMVSPTDTKKILEKKLTELSYELFLEKITKIDTKLSLKKQDEKLATCTRRLTKQDGYVSIDFINLALRNSSKIPAEFPTALPVLYEYVVKYFDPLPQQKRPVGEMLYDYYRALYDWPGIWTKVMINGVEKRLKITEMRYSLSSTPPAEAAAKAGLSIEKVQLEGKNEVEFQTFQKAYNIF